MSGEKEKIIWKDVPQDIRREYHHDGLLLENMQSNPVEEFSRWFKEAYELKLDQSNAMSLATASKDGKPSVRKVLLKHYGKEGFVFYSNYNSGKAKDLKENPQAALLFYWFRLDRQIRIEGSVKLADAQISDEYFSSRPWGAQLGAYISPQSKEIKDRDYLEQLHEQALQQYKQGELSRPKHWGGYVLIPEYFEFWQGRTNRLHDRIVYQRGDGDWQIKRLAP